VGAWWASWSSGLQERSRWDYTYVGLGMALGGAGWG
jgi:hypothetical protein